MKPIGLSFLGLTVAVSASAQVALFEFTDFLKVPTLLEPHVTSTEYTMDTDFSTVLESGITSTGGNPGHVWSGRANSGVDSYFRFNLQIENGYKFTLSSVSLDSRREGANAWTQYDVQFSTDGGSFSSLGSGNLTGTSWEQILANNGGNPLSDLSGTLYFRIYGLNGVDATRWYHDNVAVDGFLTVVPEPREFAAIAGLALFGFAAWRRRRNLPNDF